MAVPDVSNRSVGQLISLKGRTAVVTGGAQGIGFAISLRLAEAGASVLIGDINKAGAQDAAERIIASGGRAMSGELDVAKSESVIALADRAVIELGTMDIWVNNAGVISSTALLDMTEQDWNYVLNVNLRGAFIGAREAGRRMIKAGTSGVIVNITSLTGIRAYAPGLAHYASAKQGMIGLTRSLAIEFGPHNIRVLAIAPTMTATPGLEKANAAYKNVGGSALDSVSARAPLGRTAVPDDVARVALFCVSDLAMLMTGSVLLVDAGDIAL